MSTVPRLMSMALASSSAYSILAWSAEPETSRVLPCSLERIESQEDAVLVGARQVRHLGQQRQAQETFDVVVADARYGNHRFLGAVKETPCGVLVRLRTNRVLYRAPGPYSGLGRPDASDLCVPNHRSRIGR